MQTPARTVRAGILAAGVCLLLPAAAGAYVDPGTQFQAVSQGLPFLPWLLGAMGVFFGAMIWPFKKLLWWLKGRVGRAWAWTILLGGVAAILGGAALVLVAVLTGGEPTGSQPPATEVRTVPKASYDRFERVIVLGMDGLTPDIIEPMMDAGELPHFAKLRETGSYSRLQTTVPPETPVAWSSIGTGCNPGKHGLFDFLHRDPRDYRLLLSIYKVNTDRRGGPYLPVRHAEGFWTISSRSKVPTTVIRWPAAFPPEPTAGHFLSGLGVPDVCGRLGRYSLFTTQAENPNPAFKGRWCAGTWDGDAFRGKLAGPMVQDRQGFKESELDVLVRRLGGDRVALKIGDADEVPLAAGQWSGYIPIHYEPGWGKKVPAQVRAYLAAVEPHLRLYVSTPEIDATDPYFAITEPEGYAKELAAAIGRFRTLGMPEDVDAMKDGSLSPEAFERSMLDLFAERKAQFDYEFSRFDRGIFAFVFDASDRIQHMFWRTRDPEHPIYDAAFAERFGHVIPDMYKRMDGVLGEVLAKADDKTVVLVCSDHGFNTFRTAVGINSWLVANGYMVLTTPDGRNGREGFADVDWSRTRAYAVGFTNIYVNLAGRERHGIVQPGEPCRALCEEIADKLRRLSDPVSGRPAVRNVHLGREVYRGPCAADGPDLVVGFNAGFRAENSNVLGGSPLKVFSDNTDLWTGDHLMDASVVPGIFFANRPLRREPPRNIDVAPTILQCFGLPRPDSMDGEALF